MKRQMTRFSCWAIPLLTIAPFLAGYGGVPEASAGGSDPRAIALIDQAAQAQGADAIGRLHEITVGFEGKWNRIISLLQPKLVDIQFRGTSQEQYLIHEDAERQTHVGPGGTKQVYRHKSSIDVSYNGRKSTDAQTQDAAALVADNYRMFLLGPAFFRERAATLQYAGADQVDHADCDNLLADLKPGLGNSREDRVLISIDRSRHWICRVRVTMEGLESTRGAVVDIYLRDPLRIHGVLWPTSFDEVLRRPFPAPVHHWRMVSIDFDGVFDKRQDDRR